MILKEAAVLWDVLSPELLVASSGATVSVPSKKLKEAVTLIAQKFIMNIWYPLGSSVWCSRSLNLSALLAGL